MKLRIVFSLMLVGAMLSRAQAQTPVRIVAKDAFVYVKMTKEMLGGNIEVRDSVGHVVNTKTIDHRKMYLDLFDLGVGKYGVTVKHNDLVVEFTYIVESLEMHAKRKHHQANNKWGV